MSFDMGDSNEELLNIDRVSKERPNQSNSEDVSTNSRFFHHSANMDILSDGPFVTGATVEVATPQLDAVRLVIPERSTGEIADDGEYGNEGFQNEDYDPVTVDHHQLAIFEIYQPTQLEDGRLSCKICAALGQDVIFNTRIHFNAHRYKHHGTFMNALPCPSISCRDSFPSVLALKKHLQTDHLLPIECHYAHFPNLADFESWRSIVEKSTGTRFVLHARASTNKRNVLHCQCSEHRLATAGRQARGAYRGKMAKAGAVCPAHMSFTVREDGAIYVVYQLLHYGHCEDERVEGRERSTGQGSSLRIREGEVVDEGEGEEYTMEDMNAMLSLEMLFPLQAKLPRQAAMQFVQLSIVSMPHSLYCASQYSSMLIVQCIQSGFLFARSLPEPVIVGDQSFKSHVVRQLVDIFVHFGYPTGFAISDGNSALHEAVPIVEHVFNTSFQHIGHVTPDLSSFKKVVIQRSEDELGSESRWPEVLPFVVYSQNTETRGKGKTSFEMMFGRKHQWDMEEKIIEAERAQNGPYINTRFQIGDRVFVRNFDLALLPPRNIAPMNRPQPSTTILNGLISDVAWWESPYYPYKVHIARSTEEPTLDCPFVWVSPSDIAPSAVDLRNQREERRKQIIEDLRCSCGDVEGMEGGRCELIRASLCKNGMSRSCCERSRNGRCAYHEEYDHGGGDTYKKVETLYKKHYKYIGPEESMKKERVGRVNKREEENEESHVEVDVDDMEEYVAVDESTEEQPRSSKATNPNEDEQSHHRNMGNGASQIWPHSVRGKGGRMRGGRGRGGMIVMQREVFIENQSFVVADVAREEEVEEEVEVGERTRGKPQRRGILTRRGPPIKRQLHEERKVENRSEAAVDESTEALAADVRRSGRIPKRSRLLDEF